MNERRQGGSGRLFRACAIVVSTALVAVFSAAPAWAGTEAATRGGSGIGRVLLLLCCLVVTALVAVGVGIGVLIGRRRRR